MVARDRDSIILMLTARVAAGSFCIIMHKHAAARVAPASKAYRQGLIRSFVRNAPPRSQGEVRQRLRLRGVLVTQSTLSRDLRDLGLVKAASGYQDAEGLGQVRSEEARLLDMERMMRTHLNDVAVAGNLVVLKTNPGFAHALGVSIDRAALPDVVGTVSGDDTLFAATPRPSHARALERRLRGLIGRR
jgi:transcriptional regulator of arginine metabolism